MCNEEITTNKTVKYETWNLKTDSIIKHFQKCRHFVYNTCNVATHCIWWSVMFFSLLNLDLYRNGKNKIYRTIKLDWFWIEWNWVMEENISRDAVESEKKKKKRYFWYIFINNHSKWWHFLEDQGYQLILDLMLSCLKLEVIFIISLYRSDVVSLLIPQPLLSWTGLLP